MCLVLLTQGHVSLCNGRAEPPSSKIHPTGESPKQERGLNAEQEKKQNHRNGEYSPWLGTVLTFCLNYLLIFTIVF